MTRRPCAGRPQEGRAGHDPPWVPWETKPRLHPRRPHPSPDACPPPLVPGFCPRPLFIPASLWHGDRTVLVCAHVVTPTAFPPPAHPPPALLLNTRRHTVLILSRQLHGINIHSRGGRSPAASSLASVGDDTNLPNALPEGRAACRGRAVHRGGAHGRGPQRLAAPHSLGKRGPESTTRAGGLGQVLG